MTHTNHILLVDDEPALREVVADSLREDGHQVVEASNGDEALELLGNQGFQLVISDLRMPGRDGLDVVRYVSENLPGTPVILVSGYGSVDAAVEAMRLGAYDFQQKPLNLEHLRLTVQRALRQAVLGYAFDYLRREQPFIYQLDNIVAESRGMKDVLDKVRKVASTDTTVLLTGETGTGKSLVAGAIHANSPRRENTIVTVNCAALAETILESELFGHEKGSFTGAHKNRIGRIQQAHGGTLFLDEVGDMSAATQAKILRAIEDRIVQPVGSTRSIKVDVRILTATNVDLQKAVAQGRFREDLFYRISVANIHIPSLKERAADIVPLAERFLAGIAADSKRPRKVFSTASLEALAGYHWPGNIRELRNVVERAVLFSSGETITPDDLGLTPRSAPDRNVDLPKTLNLEALELFAIRTALKTTNGVQKDAAVLLGISPRALSYKLKALGLRRSD